MPTTTSNAPGPQVQRAQAPDGTCGWEVRPDISGLDLGEHARLLVARIKRCWIEQPNFSRDLLSRVNICLQHNLDGSVNFGNISDWDATELSTAAQALQSLDPHIWTIASTLHFANQPDWHPDLPSDDESMLEDDAVQPREVR